MIGKALAFALVLLWVTAPLCAQRFRNLGLDQPCDAAKTGLCHWDLSWGKPEAVRPVTLGNRKAVLLEGKQENAVVFTEQAALTPALPGFQILALSASIKSDSVAGKGAGLNIGLYDSEGTLIGTRDMGGFYSVAWVRGTRDWQPHSISIVVPPETASIKIGLILFGMGRAWFSDIAVQETPIAGRKPSKLARKYIGAALDTIAAKSLVRDSIDVLKLRETALEIAGPAKSYEACFLAVNYLLESLRPYGDHHSFFMSAQEVENWENEGSQVSKPEIPGHEIKNGFGYLMVPPFHGGNPEQITAYADSMQVAIESLYKAGIKGWIVDLRQNTGGNMAPMIGGLGPLFSDEMLGSLIDVDGLPEAWYYKRGRYYSDQDEGFAVSTPYVVPEELPIAVLTGAQTGSSGEIVVISFLGNARTRSFGQPTWGLTTGNGSFDLPDGSRLFLASTVMADRTGRQYTTRITPDVPVEDNPATEADEVLEAAIAWLGQQE